MSYREIINAQKKIELPPLYIREIIKDLLKYNSTIKKNITKKFLNSEKSELFIILNRISLKNIDLWLPKLELILKEKIKEQELKRFICIIANQPLHMDVYVQICILFENDNFSNLIKNLFGNELSSKELLNIGKFYGKFINKLEIDPNWELMKDVNIAFNIGFFIEYKNIEKNSLLENIIYIIKNNINSLETPVKMLAYDLYDIIKNDSNIIY
tara:strand:- start:314 stop:952 length:639 start_codon:yes stop_codon:yes gene_type:complete